MVGSTKQQAVPSIFDFLLFTVAEMEYLLRTPLYHTLRTNQMGYIKVKAQFMATKTTALVLGLRPRTRVGLLPFFFFNFPTTECTQ